MPRKPQPTVVDIPLGSLDLVPPPHGGPIGRLKSLINAEVQSYVLPSPQTLAKSLVQPRGGFISYATTLTSPSDGSVQHSDGSHWSSPQLLEGVGNQLLSVCGSWPRVYNGNTWTSYGDVGVRTITRQLSQQVLHTSSMTIVAPDSAVLGDVTCLVWTEVPVSEDASINNYGTSYVGFRSNSTGAWVAGPVGLYASTSTSVPAIAKVVQDGTNFWVFYVVAGTNIYVNAYNGSGQFLGQAGVAISATNKTCWDVTSYPAVTIAQAVSSSTDSGVLFTTCTWTGSAVSTTTAVDTTLHCAGPVGWLANPFLNGFGYLATYYGFTVYSYEVQNRAQTHGYVVGGVGSAVDSLTGWVDSTAGAIRVNVAYSTLAPSYATGPKYDPALRVTTTRSCDRTNTSALVSAHTSVVQVGRAFQVDDQWYAPTYYQSGPGNLPVGKTVSIGVSAGDYFIGPATQTLTPTLNSPNAYFGGGLVTAPGTSGTGEIYVTQAISSISHNSADAVIPSGVWAFNNASFNTLVGTPPCVGSYLVVTGSSISTNNQSYLIIGVRDSHTIITEQTGSNFHGITAENLSGVTAALTSNALLMVSAESPEYPGSWTWEFSNSGSVTVSGSAHSGNNVTATPLRFYKSFTPFATGSGQDGWVIPYTTQVTEGYGGASETVSASTPDTFTWNIGGCAFDDTYIGNYLVATRTSGVLGGGIDGNWKISTVPSFTSITTDDTDNPGIDAYGPQYVNWIGATFQVQLADPTTAYTVRLAAASFDGSYVGQVLTLNSTQHGVNAGSYLITQVLSSTKIQVQPLNLAAGNQPQVNEAFPSGVGVQVIFPPTSTTFQPTWLLTCLSNPNQEVAGAFESMLAYADWRYEGSSPANLYQGCLSSVCSAPDGLRMLLPFRAQSWTTDDEIIDQVETGGPILRSSVGLKQFLLSNNNGQAVSDNGSALIPGPMATAFSASGFHEAGVLLGPEQPFLVSQATGGDLTAGGSYQYVFCYEVSNEDGSQVQSIVSPPLNVVLSATSNKATIGGRFICPTNWPQAKIRVTGYRTAYQNGAPTTQHYRITNPLAPSANFSFDVQAPGGTSIDTWEFVDDVSDAYALSQPTLYTDGNQVPRQPPPAFRQGVANWNGHDWVLGYDNALWMSSEPTEGLANYYSSLWRIPFPQDNAAVAAVAMEGYLLVLCQKGLAYLPQTNNLPGAVPDPTTSLPTPVWLPFNNGCTGYAATTRQGVVYSSTAGGAWLITRDLENTWQSQPVSPNLTTVTGLALDGKQRLMVATGTDTLYVYDPLPKQWYTWQTPTSTNLITAYSGSVAYEDGAQVNLYSESANTDNVGGVASGIVMSFTIGSLSFAQVRDFVCCWGFQLIGQYLGTPHAINVTISEPDEAYSEPTVFEPFLVMDNSLPYLAEFNPTNETASTFDITVAVSFPGPIGASCAIEMLSAVVGILGGQAPVSSQQMARAT